MLIDSSASARCSPHFEMLPIIISRYRACSLSMRSQLRAESDGACRRIFSGWCSDASVSEESGSSRSFQTPQPMAASPRFWRDVIRLSGIIRTNHENRGDRLSDQGLNGRINSKPNSHPIRNHVCQPMDPCCRDPARELHFLGLLANHDQEHKSEHNAR